MQTGTARPYQCSRPQQHCRLLVASDSEVRSTDTIQTSRSVQIGYWEDAQLSQKMARRHRADWPSHEPSPVDPIPTRKSDLQRRHASPVIPRLHNRLPNVQSRRVSLEPWRRQAPECRLGPPCDLPWLFPQWPSCSRSDSHSSHGTSQRAQPRGRSREPTSSPDQANQRRLSELLTGPERFGDSASGSARNASSNPVSSALDRRAARARSVRRGCVDGPRGALL